MSEALAVEAAFLEKLGASFDADLCDDACEGLIGALSVSFVVDRRRFRPATTSG